MDIENFNLKDFYGRDNLSPSCTLPCQSGKHKESRSFFLLSGKLVLPLLDPLPAPFDFDLLLLSCSFFGGWGMTGAADPPFFPLSGAFDSPFLFLSVDSMATVTVNPDRYPDTVFSQEFLFP